MKILITTALVLGLFTIQKSSAYGENNGTYVCTHFGNSSAERIYNVPASNGLCPLPPSNSPDHNDSSSSTKSSVGPTDGNDTIDTGQRFFHNSAECQIASRKLGI